MSRILVVDDHAIVRSGIRRLLSDLPGLKLQESASGEDALEAVRYWRRQGNAQQAARAVAEFSVCLARYRRRMRSFRIQLDYVRGPLGVDAVSARSQKGRSGPLAHTAPRNARVDTIPSAAAPPREPATNVG